MSYSNSFSSNATSHDLPNQNSNKSKYKKSGSFILKKKNIDGTPDMRYTENREQFLEPGMCADGTPDMRLLQNRIKYGLYKE